MFERPLRPRCLIVLWILAIGMFSPVWAGHEAVPCAACHGPVSQPAAVFASGERGYEQSLLCLSCHDARMDSSGLRPPYVIDGGPELAGGSFTATRVSDKAGHNIESVDATLGTTPPGGGHRDELSCLSCHDPHNNGNFRNLKKQINGRSTPVRAMGDPAYRNNVYISGMSQFCGACHEKFYGDANIRSSRGYIRHPVEISIAGARNADYHNWSRLENRVTRAEYPGGSPENPRGARVFCLSCHRAHGTPYKNALRWDYENGAGGCLECHSF